MKRAARHLTSIALVVAAAGVATYAYLDRATVTESEKKLREGSVFVAWRKDDLARIELTQGASSLVLERTVEDGGDRSWFMRAPREERADDGAVERLASALEMATVLRKVDGETAPGLDVPRVRGKVTMGSVEHRFALGGIAASPAGASYLRLEAAGASPARVVVVSRDLAAALLQPEAAYRTRAVVPYLSIELKAMDVRGPTTHFAIERVDEVSFKGPDGLRVSRARLDAAWSALAAMRAEVFPADADADRATTAPRFVITMTPRVGARPRGELLVGDACPGQPEDVVVVRTAPTRLAACVPKAALDGLALTAESLRDDALFVAHDDEVAELRMQTLPAGPSLDLARKESGWRERSPADRDLPPDEVEAATDLVRGIVKTTGALPATVRGEPPFEVRGRVTIVRADAPGPEVIELGPPAPGGDVPARRVFDGATLRLSRAAARRLSPRSVSLRAKAMWSPPIEGRAVRALATECDGVAQRLSSTHEGFRVDAPAGFAPDRAAVLELVDLVARAKAEAWVADADDGTFGLDGARCAITLSVDEADAGEGARTRSFEIAFGREADAEDGAGVYARIDGAVLVAPAYLRDRARTWLLDRHGFAVSPGADVTLRRGGRTVAASEAALRALAILVPSEVVHLGPARPDEGLDVKTVEVVARAGGDAAPGAGAARPTRFFFGRAQVRGGVTGYHARMDGVDATFFVPKERVEALLGP